MDRVESQQYVMVCIEVARGAPVLLAVRSELLDENDSGWQFLCGAPEEDHLQAQIWAVHELLERDQSVAKYIDYPIGTVLRRATGDSEWKVSIE